MPDDATPTEGTSPEAESTEESSEQPGITQEELIASYRKRQAGADAARLAEKARADSLEKQVAAYKAKELEAAGEGISELAREKALREAAEQRAAEAEAKAEARILDAKFPNARKELPEVTDEVRLAKFEAMLRDDEEEETPTPRRSSAPRGGTSAASQKPKTIEDLEAGLKAIEFPW